MRYGFLLGRRFKLQNRLFHAVDVHESGARRTVVHGIAEGDAVARRFPADLVVEALIEDDETGRTEAR